MDNQIHFDLNRVMAVMSEILSDQYGCKITMTLQPKEEAQQEAPIPA